MALQSISQIIFVGPQQVFLGVGDMTKLWYEKFYFAEMIYHYSIYLYNTVIFTLNKVFISFFLYIKCILLIKVIQK